MNDNLRVVVARLGAIGHSMAATLLDYGIDGLVLSAVSTRDPQRARQRTARFQRPPPVKPLERLADAQEIIVGCLPPALFHTVARPGLDKGRILVPASVGALVQQEDLVPMAGQSGDRIIAPSGAIVSIDGLRAAAEAGLQSVVIVTRKPPTSFDPELLVEGRRIGSATLTESVRLFTGSMRDGIRFFPVNVNVAAAVSPVGLGSDRMQIEVWTDPDINRNEHGLSVKSVAGEFTAAVSNRHDPENPKSSAITAYSIVATLPRLVEPMIVGS